MSAATTAAWLTLPSCPERVNDFATLGLYLNPPDNELVVCVDEKSQLLTHQRTQPVLPVGWGYVEGGTHDYKRHGTTALFAALDLLTGAVLSTCNARHRHQESLG